MMKRTLCTLLAAIMLLTIMPLFASAEELTGLTATEVVAQMGLGWNLGNTFDAHNGRKTPVSTHETVWGNPKVTPALIHKVKEAGFKTIGFQTLSKLFYMGHAQSSLAMLSKPLP